MHIWLLERESVIQHALLQTQLHDFAVAEVPGFLVRVPVAAVSFDQFSKFGFTVTYAQEDAPLRIADPARKPLF